MRAVQLAKVGFDAEKLRLRQQAKRMATRGAMGAVAGVFVLLALIALHAAAVMALAAYVTLWQAALIVAGADIVVALILGLLAARDHPGAVEREALAVRQAAQAQLQESLAIISLVRPLARGLGARSLYGVALAALTAHFLGGRK
jgi:uncharacterized membrane protein